MLGAHFLFWTSLLTSCDLAIAQGVFNGEPPCTNWTYTHFKSTNFSTPTWNVTKTGQTEPGYIFIGPLNTETGQGAPTILQDNGQIIWRSESDFSANAVRPQVLDGETYLTYIRIEELGEGGFGWGHVPLLDQSYNEVYRVTLGGNGSGLNFRTVKDAKPTSFIDLHENEITKDGTMLVIAVNLTLSDLRPLNGPENGWVIDGQIYEIDIKTNEVLFRWSMVENRDQVPLEWCHEPLNGHGFNSSLPFGYPHLNSVAKYGDHYLVNSRYLCRFFWINQNGTVEWSIDGRNGGDFRLEPGADFCFQHDPRILAMDGDTWTIALHNNGNAESNYGAVVSTGLVIDVNFNTSIVSPNKRMWNSRDPVYSISQGSFQALDNGHYLAGRGSSPTVEEYDENGALIMTAQFGINRVSQSYRAYRGLWTGQPKTKPSVFACRDGGKTVMYISWNGATGVTDWRIHHTSGNGTSVTEVPKNGFETRVTLEGMQSASVEAVGGHLSGTKSPMISVNGTCSS